MPNFNQSYIGPRPELQRLVPPSARRILDVGCSTGTLGAALKARTRAEVTGIEMAEEMAAEARRHLDRVLVGDAAALLGTDAVGDARFDVIIFGDVLEHMVDPWQALRDARGHLAESGTVIASLPNVRHLDTIYNLVVRGRWPYRKRGIHDRTHLRFFTRSNIEELFRSAGFRIELLKPVYRLIERPHGVNKYARFFALPGVRGFLAFQYLVSARAGGA